MFSATLDEIKINIVTRAKMQPNSMLYNSTDDDQFLDYASTSNTDATAGSVVEISDSDQSPTSTPAQLKSGTTLTVISERSLSIISERINPRSAEQRNSSLSYHRQENRVLLRAHNDCDQYRTLQRSSSGIRSRSLLGRFVVQRLSFRDLTTTWTGTVPNKTEMKYTEIHSYHGLLLVQWERHRVFCLALEVTCWRSSVQQEKQCDTLAICGQIAIIGTNCQKLFHGMKITTAFKKHEFYEICSNGMVKVDRIRNDTLKPHMPVVFAQLNSTSSIKSAETHHEALQVTVLEDLNLISVNNITDDFKDNPPKGSVGFTSRVIVLDPSRSDRQQIHRGGRLPFHLHCHKDRPNQKATEPPIRTGRSTGGRSRNSG
nr:uncharacterized protein LOC109423026 [Aedes albopictus]